MKKAISKFIYLFLFTSLISSCRKELNTHSFNDSEIPITDEEKHQVAFLKEVGKVLEDVYQDPYAFYEVNAAIYSEYYTDESVLLKDLLFPEASPLYQTKQFLSFKATPGKFSKVFFETLKKGDYPLLKNALNSVLDSKTSLRTNAIMATLPTTDTANEVFSNSNGVGIYFPYSENFGSNFGPNYFDNINKGVRSRYYATIVSPSGDVDSGPGENLISVAQRIIWIYVIEL